MFKLIVCIVVLTAGCCAEERFMCSRFDENGETKSSVLKQLKLLTQEVKDLKKQSKENRQLIAEASKGLYIPPHVYIYKLTSSKRSWQQGQQSCQDWGGDLAVYGVKTLENRRKLIKNLPISDDFWIGVNDFATEGNWTWVNGEPAKSSEIIWDYYHQQPNGGNEDCVAVVAYPAATYRIGLTHDGQCHWGRLALCEKKLLTS